MSRIQLVEVISKITINSILGKCPSDQKLLGEESAKGTGAGEASHWNTACAGVCRRVRMHVHRSLCLKQEEQIMSQIFQRTGHTSTPPASVLVTEPRFLKQIKQRLASSTAICVTLHDSGAVLEFQFPLKQKGKNSLDDMRIPGDHPQDEDCLCVVQSSA